VLQELTTIALHNDPSADELSQPQSGWVKLENFNQVSVTATVYGRRTWLNTGPEPDVVMGCCYLFVENSATGQSGTWNELDMGGVDTGFTGACVDGEGTKVFKFDVPPGTLVGPWFRWKIKGVSSKPGEISFRIVIVGENTIRCS
jgi:hypothetical protein